MKAVLLLIYVVGACIMFLVDFIGHYGEDSFIFWILIREWISLVKAIFWPLTVWM